MNVKLKKFSVVKPKVKIKAGFKTIAHNVKPSPKITGGNSIVILFGAIAITGNLTEVN